MAEVIGIMGVVGVLDVSIRAFTYVYDVLKASGELCEEVGRVLDLCKQVKELVVKYQDKKLPKSIAINLESTLKLVSDTAAKYENVASRLERFKNMPRAKGRLEKLSVVENQMKTVLALITANIAGATSAELKGIASRMLEQKRALQDLSSDLDDIRAGVHDANDKLDKLDTLVRAVVPTPGEINDRTRTDCWKYSVSTVPTVWDCMLGVDDLSVVRDLKEAVLGQKCGRVAAVGVQGSGGVGKTTACAIIARDPHVRKLYKDGSAWIQLGDNASAATVVTEVAHIVRQTGGHQCATEIEESGDKDLDEVQKKARSWFAEKSILLVVDNVFPTDNVLAPGGNWISILQKIPSANSCVLFSTRSREIARLSTRSVDFAPLTSFEEQEKLFLQHLGRSSNAMDFDDGEHFAKVHKICGGVPLALATVASYLRSDHNNLRNALDALQASFLREEKQALVLGGHAGLFAIFGAVLGRLDEDNEASFLRKIADKKLPSELPYSWTDLYTSLSVLDKSSPHAPVGILAGLWGIEVDITQLVCLCFADLGLGTLTADGDAPLKFRLHDLQWTYCMIRNRHSSSPRTSLSAWHARLLEGLVRKTREIDHTSTMAETSPVTASSQRAAQYVDAFCAIREDSAEKWMEQYWLDQFVRHVRGVGDGIGVATEVVTDYRWVRRVAERRTPAGVARSIEQLLAADEVDADRLNEGGLSSGAARGVSRYLSAMNEQDVSELEAIAHVFRWEIPPEAASRQRNLSKKAASQECAVHPGQWSVGDPGLAHRIIGRFGFLLGGGGTVEGATAGSSEAGRVGVMDALVASVEKYARGPWLCPNHPCFVGLDRNGRVIRRREVQCCLAYSHGGEDCAALGCVDGNVYLHRLENGEEVGVLHADEEAKPIWSMTVSSQETSVSDGVGATWLVVGHGAGIVRIWDVEGARCIARLHASVGVSYLRAIWISRDGGRIVAGDVDNHILHVWDISPEGEQKKYGRVEVPGDEWTRRETLSQFAAAAALCGESWPLDECSNAVTRFRRIRRIRSATSVISEQEGLQRIRRHESGSSACGCCLGNRWRRLRRSRHEMLVGLEQDGLEMSVSTENDFIRDNGNRVMCALVQGCGSRALLAAVDRYHGGITVLDALTGEKLSESPPFWQDDEDKSKWDLRCVSASQVDGRALVATGHIDSMVRVRWADSGALIGQWQASRYVDGIFLDAGSRRVLARGYGEVIVWSFTLCASSKQGEPTAQFKEKNNARPSHEANCMALVGFSPDGQTAVSWDRWHKDLIVWDAATGNSVRRVILDWPRYPFSRAIAVSSSAEWTLIVGHERGERTNADFALFDSSGEERSRGTFHRLFDGMGEWSAAFSPDGRGCTVAVEVPECETKEVHEFTISDAGELTELGNRVAPSACLEANPAKQLLLQYGFRYYRDLVVRRSVRGEQARCTCTAVAYFDTDPQSSSSWSNVTIPGGSSEHSTSSTVAVGLDDGTVHFMAFLEE